MSLIEALVILLLTFITSLGIIRYSIKLKFEGAISVVKSQSTIHYKFKKSHPHTTISKKHTSQAKNFVSDRMFKIIEIDGRAYWVKDNTFFMANMINGKIDHDSVTEVDTINMSKKDLDRMMFIVDKLKDDE